MEIVLYNVLCDAGGAQIWYSDNLEGWDGVGGGKEAQDGGDTHILMTDSCSYIEETNTIL